MHFAVTVLISPAVVVNVNKLERLKIANNEPFRGKNADNCLELMFLINVLLRTS